MSEPPQSSDRPVLSRRAHVVLYSGFCLVLLYGLVQRYFRPLVLDEVIPVETDRVAQVQQRIDPNSATWSELARLPGVGESLAKRIVDYRESEQPRRTGPVFRVPADLEAVKGIGPKTLERILPGLIFPQAQPLP